MITSSTIAITTAAQTTGSRSQVMPHLGDRSGVEDVHLSLAGGVGDQADGGTGDGQAGQRERRVPYPRRFEAGDHRLPRRGRNRRGGRASGAAHGTSMPGRSCSSSRRSCSAASRGERVEPQTVLLLPIGLPGADGQPGQAEQPVHEVPSHVDAANPIPRHRQGALGEQAAAHLDLRRGDPVAGGEPAGDTERDERRRRPISGQNPFVVAAVEDDQKHQTPG